MNDTNNDNIDTIESHIKLYIIIFLFYLIPFSYIIFYLGMNIISFFPFFLLIVDIIVNISLLIMYRKDKIGYNLTEILHLWFACMNITMFIIYNLEIIIPLLI